MAEHNGADRVASTAAGVTNAALILMPGYRSAPTIGKATPYLVHAILGAGVTPAISVIADSVQFSTLATRVIAPHTVGTVLALQTSIGFLLTTIAIQLVPPVVGVVGWRYAFPMLTLGSALGIVAIRRLRA